MKLPFSNLLKIPFLMCMPNDSSDFVKKLQKSHSILTVENLSPSSPNIVNFSWDHGKTTNYNI